MGRGTLTFPFNLIVIILTASVTVHFTKPRGERRGNPVCIEVGDVTDGLRPEGSQTRPAFFTVYGCDRGWRHTQPLPQQHGRAVDQMAQQHAAQAEMAKESDGFMVRFISSVEKPFPCIAMGGKQFVKCFCYLVIFFPDTGFRKIFLFSPAKRVQQNWLSVQILRQPIPGDSAVTSVQFRPPGRQTLPGIPRSGSSTLATRSSARSAATRSCSRPTRTARGSS